MKRDPLVISATLLSSILAVASYSQTANAAGVLKQPAVSEVPTINKSYPLPNKFYEPGEQVDIPISGQSLVPFGPGVGEQPEGVFYDPLYADGSIASISISPLPPNATAYWNNTTYPGTYEIQFTMPTSNPQNNIYTVILGDNNSAGSAYRSFIINGTGVPHFHGSIPELDFEVNVPVNVDLGSYFSAPETVNYTVTPALPAGLTLDPSTGVISGTPSAQASVDNVVVNADDKGGSANSNPFKVVVGPDQGPILNKPLPNLTGMQGAKLTPIDLTPYITSGDGTDTLKCTQTGTIPAGTITVSPDCKSITGSFPASPGTFTDTITVTNDQGPSFAITPTLSVVANNGAPVPKPGTSIPTQDVSPGQAINPIDFTQYFDDPETGNPGDLSFTLNPGTLPPGLNMGPDGHTLQGTITPQDGKPSKNPFTVEASNSHGNASLTFELDINGQDTLYCPTTSQVILAKGNTITVNSTLGTPYNFTTTRGSDMQNYTTPDGSQLTSNNQLQCNYKDSSGGGPDASYISDAGFPLSDGGASGLIKIFTKPS